MVDTPIRQSSYLYRSVVQGPCTINIVMKLIKELDYWIRLAMSGLPEKLCTVKLKLSHRFCQSLGRKLSISQLSQRFNSILRNKSAINQLFKDWSRLDVENKILQMLPGGNHINNSSWNKIRKWCREFGRILRHATSVEMITGWLENFVNSCVFEFVVDKPHTIEEHIKKFNMLWKHFETKIVCEMTLTANLGPMYPACTNIWVRDLGNYRYPVEKISECTTQYGKKDPRCELEG
ncbi:Transcription factor RFX4 [Nymphon striatum]|nr:Transcription factor RFX4 [Nymphon striatum]